MSLCRHAWRRTVPTCGSVRSDPLWITDDLLARVFAKFVGSSQRRHGSNVPGPLEAKRRLNKRRNMNLARAGAGAGGAIDPALLFGVGSHRDRTNSQTAVAEEASDQVPFVMAPLPPPPTPGTYPSDADTDLVLSCRLQEASTVEDVRTLVAELEVNLERRPDLSRMIFKHILSACPDIEIVHSFLSDHSLNTPNAENFAVLAKHLVDNGTQIEDLAKHVELLAMMVSLGPVSAHELLTVVRLFPDIKVGEGTLETQDPDSLGFTWHKLWKHALVRFKREPRYYEDLDFNAWLETILTRTPSGASLAVAKRIITDRLQNCPLRYFTLYILQQLKLAQHSYHGGLRTVGRRVFASSDAPVCRYLRRIEYFGKLIPRESFALCMMDVTEALLVPPSCSRSVEYNSDVCLAWAYVLQRLECASDLLSIPETLSNLERQRSVENCPPSWSLEQECALRLWLVSNVGLCTVSFRQGNEQRRAIFASLFRYMERSSSGKKDTIGYLENLLDDLKTHGLGKTGVVSLIAAIKWEYRLSVDDKTGPLSECIDRLVRLVEKGHIDIQKMTSYGYKRKLIGRLYNRTRRYRGTCVGSKIVIYGRNTWFHDLAQSVDITSKEFYDEIMQYIDQQTPRRAILQAILKSHVGAKIALGLAQVVPGGFFSQESDDTALQPFRKSNHSIDGSRTPDGRFIPHPDACLQVFQTICMIYAFSPNLHVEGAWRRTHKWFKFLKWHGAPITPVVVRSLYHAGIVRFREEGRKIPLERCAFIVRLARQVEGPSAADKIRWNVYNGVA